MKSEKAIQRLCESFAINSNIGIDRKAAAEAVEIAEREAEERMWEKAVEAFLSCCYCEEYQYVRKKCENCEVYKSYIEKLDEEY